MDDLNEKREILMQIKERWNEINMDPSQPEIEPNSRTRAWRAIFDHCRAQGHKWTLDRNYKWLYRKAWPKWREDFNCKQKQLKNGGNDVFNELDLIIKELVGTVAAEQNGAQPDECIEILDEEEDDDIKVIEEPEPTPKKARIASPTSCIQRNEQSRSPVPEDPKISKEFEKPSITQTSNAEVDAEKHTTKLCSYTTLLGQLVVYVRNAIDGNQNVDRKVLDAMLAAINVQVQKEPYSVRKLILDKQLVLPNTISFPPSQVVDMLIEHDPDHQLSRVITRLFGEERPKLTENERKERQLLKALYPAPNMTKLLLEIGQDLVQETTYYDIVHAKNLPEQPKNMETYKQVAAQLRPVWETLKAKNEPHKLKIFTCQACGYKTDSQTVLNEHRQTLHFIGRRYQCTYCPEFDTNEYRITKHILSEHGVKAISEELLSSQLLCPICEEQFNYKVQRNQHLRMCRRDVHKLRTIQTGRAPEDINMINRWLWDKPPTEPSILNQQQEAQRQQQLRQQQLLLHQQQQKFQQAAQLVAAANLTANQRQRSLLGNGTFNQLMNRNYPVGGTNGVGASAVGNGHLQSTLKMAQDQRLKHMRGGNAGRQGQGTSVGDLVRGNVNITPQIIQAAMQAQLMQMQNKQKSQQAVSAAAATFVQQQQTPSSACTRNGKSTNAHSRGNQGQAAASSGLQSQQVCMCEICDISLADKERYRVHLQTVHKQLLGKTSADMQAGAPLACSRCRERFWTYEGLERHLVMTHGLVTGDLLTKAQQRNDAGKCKLCAKQYAFNLLQHLVSDHQVKLCSAEIMYSCDVCAFKCSSYQKLESHLAQVHPKTR